MIGWKDPSDFHEQEEGTDLLARARKVGFHEDRPVWDGHIEKVHFTVHSCYATSGIHDRMAVVSAHHVGCERKPRVETFLLAQTMS